MIWKGIRSLFYRQEELEKRGWDLPPSQQRKFDNWGNNMIDLFFAYGLCVTVLCGIFISQTDETFNSPMIQIIYMIMIPAIVCFIIGLIGLLTKK